MHDAITEAEIRLVAKIAAGEPRDAAWLLTHSPFFRDDWSDAAAERRAVRAEQGRFVAALDTARVPHELQRRILLALQAHGGNPDTTLDTIDAWL